MTILLLVVIVVGVCALDWRMNTAVKRLTEIRELLKKLADKQTAPPA